jgi:menaquinone-9 beta-reductase
MVAEAAVKAGATLWQATEAIAPLVEGGLVVGALAKRKESGALVDVRGRYLLVADGANSRFGRALGTARARRYPLGMAIRGYFRSPGHDQDWIESHLDLRDRKGDALPGYGWIFPVGDGTVNVGVGLLSTFRDWKGVNTSHLMEAFVEMAPAHWELSPDTATCAPTGGRLPMGNSVEPSAGPTWLVAGDAAGSINPFNGEGIAYAYETGRIAAEVLDQALRTGDGLALARYPARLEDAYGLYFRVARAFVRAIGNPLVMRELTRVGMRSRSLMEWVLRIMSNMLRPDEVGPAEAAYRLVERLVALGPEP